jgi:O-antigen/teichoic acid export membrane protein
MLVAQVITGALGLTRNALLARFLAKEDYGALSYLLNGLSVVALLGLPGLGVAVAQYVARGHSETVRLGLRRRLLFASLPMITLFAAGWMGLQSRQHATMPSLWFLTALFFPTAQVLSLVGSVLGARKRFRSLARYLVGQSAVFLLAAVIGLWVWPGQKTTGVVLFQWLLLSLLNIWFWAKLRRPKSQVVPLSPAQQAKFYAFGTHMTVLSGIGELRARVGALLLGSFVSLSSLADYAIGDLFLEQMKALWTIYYTVSYPRLINLNPRDRWRQVGREARLATPAFAALGCVGGIGLSLAIPWLFSAKYTSSLAYIWILLLAFVFSIPGGFFEMYFRLEEAEGALYRIRLVSDVVGVVLPAVMLVLWGPLGVPAGRASARLVYSFVGFIMYRFQGP